jgi:very-short-patch-repair endonuclease
MAALLACSERSALTAGSGAALLRIGEERGVIEVAVPVSVNPRQRGIKPHRLSEFGSWGWCDGLRVMDPATVLVSLATYLDHGDLEAAVNAADRQNLINPEQLRAAIERMPRRPGKGILRRTLDRRTFVFTDSALERFYLPLSDHAGLARPRTQRYVNSFRVDFIYEIGLVVETNGLRYHRTAAQQTRDLVRSQIHTAKGLRPLTFSHAQIRYDPDHVVRILRDTAALLMVERRAA